MILSDGTQVWFNSETVMEFPVEFVGETREVKLIGEAYFKVIHDVNKPYTVNTPIGEIEVLGTSFNISAYTNDSYMATTLVEGSVKVSSDQESVVIAPGVQAIVNKGSTGVITRKVNTDLYTSWVNGIFGFENANLEYICERLGRWYNVDFEFQDQSLKKLHFTGVAIRKENVDKICSIIEKTTNVEFIAQENKIRVTRE
jgi:ferric-dicitrate binding protein FerR (iron transport regulator)